MSHPVCVVCPECSAIYTPDVESVDARLASQNRRLFHALHWIAAYGDHEGDLREDWAEAMRNIALNRLAAEGEVV